MREFQEFPKWKYHAEKAACIVDDSEAEHALGSGWVDSPAELQTPEAELAPMPETREEPAPKRQSRRSKA